MPGLTDSMSLLTGLLPFIVLAGVLWFFFRRRNSQKPEVVENPFDVRFVWEEESPALRILNRSKDPMHQVISRIQVKDRSFSPIFWRKNWIDFDTKEWGIVTPNWERYQPVDFEALADFLRANNLAKASMKDDLSELITPRPIEMRVVVTSEAANMPARVLTLSTTASEPEKVQPTEDNMEYWRMSMLN